MRMSSILLLDQRHKPKTFKLQATARPLQARSVLLNENFHFFFPYLIIQIFESRAILKFYIVVELATTI